MAFSELYISHIGMSGEPEEEYLARIPAIRQIAREGLDLHRPVTFLVGENGMGKSTLLEAIAVAWASTRRAELSISISPPGTAIPACGKSCG